MVLEYDSDLDLLYIKLCEGLCTESEEVKPGVVLDYDRNHRVVGIEIEHASETMDKNGLGISGTGPADEGSGR